MRRECMPIARPSLSFEVRCTEASAKVHCHENAHRLTTIAYQEERKRRDVRGRRDRLTAAPADGAVIAIAEGEPLPRVPPARSSERLHEGSKPQGRDAARLGS